uniref:PDZ domain-containing protein n=1 Tax=Plectus sambesii TaxID=2011161 RepID=A0A914UYL8_9BILA
MVRLVTADETGQLFVGDAIVEVNGILVEGRTHDEVVNLMKNAGEEITIVVRHYTQLATYLRPSESLRRDRSGSALERYSDTSGTWKSKTFACNFDGRPSGLVIDLRQGFSLYDIPTKRYIWQYRFSQLQTSADDGKMRMQLVFRNPDSPDGKDVKDLDCAEIYPLVYTMHAFYLAKIIGQDPDFLKTAPL